MSGANKSGVGHWKEQRIAAVVMLPLAVWLVFSLFALAGKSHWEVTAWIGETLNGVLLILFIGALFRHMKLGLEVVIDDYVHDNNTNKGLHFFVNAACGILMALGIVSVIIILSNS